MGSTQWESVCAELGVSLGDGGGEGEEEWNTGKRSDRSKRKVESQQQGR